MYCCVFLRLHQFWRISPKCPLRGNNVVEIRIFSISSLNASKCRCCRADFNQARHHLLHRRTKPLALLPLVDWSQSTRRRGQHV